MSERDTNGREISERDGAKEFAAAGQAKERGLVGELVSFMAETRSWWMLPLLIVFGLLGVILVLGATGVAPFLYPLFG
ncbi:MAG: hypothetical protein ACI89X_000013 [Planctomycetota bacterium]|jgi:hypothetical protein